jgi:5-(carboxyamino)imidazole ribonucleotide mutase
MNSKVAIIISKETDLDIMNEAIKVLDEYAVQHQIIKVNEQNADINSFAKNAYNDGIRVIIAGTRGNVNFSNTIAAQTSLPVIGVPCKSEDKANTVESIFSVLQQPNTHPVANVALDAGQNAGILAVQILALADSELQKKVIEFKENLKNKILKADKEMAQFTFEYRTN